MVDNLTKSSIQVEDCRIDLSTREIVVDLEDPKTGDITTIRRPFFQTDNQPGDRTEAVDERLMGRAIRPLQEELAARNSVDPEEIFITKIDAPARVTYRLAPRAGQHTEP